MASGIDDQQVLTEILKKAGGTIGARDFECHSDGHYFHCDCKGVDNDGYGVLCVKLQYLGLDHLDQRQISNLIQDMCQQKALVLKDKGIMVGIEDYYYPYAEISLP